MKKTTLLLAFLLFVFCTQAQRANRDHEEINTLFGNNIDHGGYLSLGANYSQINDKDAILIGGKLGWVIDHRLTIGLGGYGFVNNIEFDDIIDDENFELVGGYGGLLIEPIMMSRMPVHISFPIIIGAGGVGYQKDNDYWEDEWEWEDSDAFFVIEPGIEVELNLIKYLRFAVGATYRHTADLNLVNTKSDILNGVSYGFSIKVGKF